MSKSTLPSLGKGKASGKPRLMRSAMIAGVIVAIFQLGRLYEKGSLDETIDAVETFVVAQGDAIQELTSSLF
jgi:hypothetical protein